MIRKLKKKHSTITTRDLYIHYLENQDKHDFTLDYEKWKKVMYSLFYKLSKSVIEANLVYKFESGLGIYGIEKVKGKEKRRIDFNQTRKLGRTVYHGNLHTDCYYFRFVWRKKRTAFHMNIHIYLSHSKNIKINHPKSYSLSSYTTTPKSLPSALPIFPSK